jgi:membrane-associated phospholipid phosphatase
VAIARALIGTLVVLFVATIAVSRVTLGVHTLLEVAVGLMVGGLAHWWFAHSYAKMAPLRVDAKTFGVALTVTAAGRIRRASAGRIVHPAPGPAHRL